ncbi:MAG: GDP-mannose 4,6-dehydratase [Verrucomicrobiae bacterium]|nr:GDP-mannose 4,6-dehydratase [Verrucomicrobiae bacterium]
MPRALITGITGQDGSYLSELLLEKGYEVHGLVRDPGRMAGSRIAAWMDRLVLHGADLTDGPRLGDLIPAVAPDEIYHLAARTHVPESWEDPVDTLSVNVVGTARLLEACRRCATPPRLFHASTCQVFGESEDAPQDEQTPFRPVNPYGASKACATDLVRMTRDAAGLFLVNGICYNHESPRRETRFVISKICTAAARIRRGIQQELPLGNLTARRDWGDAREFVRGFWASLQAEQPADYVFATGQEHSVEDILKAAFGAVGLRWQDHVVVNPALLRATDPGRLVGNPKRAREVLGWQTRRTLPELVAEMTQTVLDAGT